MRKILSKHNNNNDNDNDNDNDKKKIMVMIKLEKISSVGSCLMQVAKLIIP